MTIAVTTIICKIPGLFNRDYNSFKGYVKDLWFGLFDNDGNKRTNVLGSRYTTTLKSMMIAIGSVGKGLDAA